MFVTAVSVRVVRPYVIEVGFDDGVKRDVDIEPLFWGPVFAPLRDMDVFRQAKINPTFGSVYWPTGADLAPEFLYYGEEGPPSDYFEGTSEEEEAPLPAMSKRR